jgi:hypothetical protein
MFAALATSKVMSGWLSEKRDITFHVYDSKEAQHTKITANIEDGDEDERLAIKAESMFFAPCLNAEITTKDCKHTPVTQTPGKSVLDRNQIKQTPGQSVLDRNRTQDGIATSQDVPMDNHKEKDNEDEKVSAPNEDQDDSMIGSTIDTFGQGPPDLPDVRAT